MKMHARLLTVTAVGSALGAALLAGGAAQAQEAGVGEVVVTAQKREQRLQDVPLAVSAVSGETLADQGITSPQDLRYVSPSINYTSSANSRGEGFQVRGVGTAVFGDGIEQSVGVVIDGVSMGRNSMSIQDMVDVARVEVLRGPQGMLFGRNASAGLINIITNSPEIGETSLALRATLASEGEFSTASTVNIGLGEQAAFRATYTTIQRDGNVRNRLTNQLLNNRDVQAVRAQLLVEPTPSLSFRIIGDWMESDALCCTWTARTAPAASTFAVLNAQNGITPSPANREIAAGDRFFQMDRHYGLSTEVNWDLGFAGLTSLSAYRNWVARDNNDPDLLPVGVLSINSGFSEVDQFTQELRLTSPGGQNLEWTVGLFYLNLVNDGGNEQTGTLGLALPPGGTLGNLRTSITTNESVAVFGQASYAVFDKLRLTAGVRFTRDDLELTYNNSVSGTLGGIPGRFVGSAKDSRSEDNFSWRVIGQYDFTDDILAYASVARGYKGPAYDQSLVSPSVVFVEPEIPTSYELGLRSQFFDRSLTVNLAAFTTEFKDFQAQVFDQNVFPSRFITANAGSLETEGVEFETIWRPLEGVTLNANAAYIEATYGDFKNIACYPGQPVLPFGTPRTSPRQCIRIVNTPTGATVTEGTGNPLPNSPEFTYNLAAEWERPLGNLTFTARVNYFWRDEVSYSDAGDPLLRQDAYGLLGGRIGIGAADGAWRLSAFGRNLTDEAFVNRVFAQPTLGGPGISSQYPSLDDQRIIGVTLDLKFGGR